MKVIRLKTIYGVVYLYTITRYLHIVFIIFILFAIESRLERKKSSKSLNITDETLKITDDEKSDQEYVPTFENKIKQLFKRF